MPRTDWDVAQVCLNGHAINDIVGLAPQLNEDRCSQCGEQTITECPACKEPIRGYLHREGAYRAHVKPRTFLPSAFCHKCGAPYPWTERALDAARQLVQEIEGLSSEERQELAETFPDIVSNTPKTAVASSRFKRLVGKAGGAAARSFEGVLGSVASETARRLIWGGSG